MEAFTDDDVQKDIYKFMENNQFQISRNGLSPRELLQEMKELIKKVHGEGLPKEVSLEDLELGICFKCPPIIKEGFFGGDLDSIIGAYDYIIDSTNYPPIPESHTVEFQFTPSVVEEDGDISVVYDLQGLLPFPCRNGDTEVPYYVRMSVLTSRKANFVEEDEKHIPRKVGKKITLVYHEFNLSRFDYNPNGVIKTISSEELEEILYKLVSNGCDVCTFAEESFELQIPRPAKSARM